jgi:hypothetical protein
MKLEKLQQYLTNMNQVFKNERPFFLGDIRDFLTETKPIRDQFKGYYALQRMLDNLTEKQGELAPCGIIDPQIQQHNNTCTFMISLLTEVIRDFKCYAY